MGYTKTAAKGVSWIGLLRISTRVLTILRISLLGRLLTPSQFGYFGIASLLLAFLEVLTETGINVFLVQEKRDINVFINSAWIISIIRGVVLSCIILLSAPYIAAFFNSPEAYGTIALMAVVPFIRGFINPAIIIYQKDLLFQREFILRFVLFSIDAIITIAFAFLTREANSFVYGLMASAFVEVILSFILIRIWPKLLLEYDKIKLILRRGLWVTLTGLFAYFADNGDNIVVGKILGSSSLGIYQVAYKLSTLSISEITNVVNQVIFPVFVKFSDDKKRLLHAFIKVTLTSTALALVLGCVLFFFAEPIIRIFVGDQWLAAVPVVKVLALYGILRTMFGNFAPLFLSLQKQRYVAQMTFIRVLTLIVVIVPLVFQFGMVGAGLAMLVSIIAEIPVILFFMYKIFRIQ